jgi:hypothetical protein
MSLALDEFFAAVEEEFGVSIGGDARDQLATPGDVIDFVADSVPPEDGDSSVEHRDRVASSIGELMEQTLGLTHYRESSRFIQDLRVR